MDIIVAPEGKFAKICKLMDFVLIGLLVLTFILTLVPAFTYNVTYGEITYSDNKPKTIEATYVDSDVVNSKGEAITLDLPYKSSKASQYESGSGVEKFSLLGYAGFTTDYEVINEQLMSYLKSMDTKVISFRQIGIILFIDIFLMIAIWTLLAKKGLARPIFCLIWGIVSLAGFYTNHLLQLINTSVKPIMIAVLFVATAISLIASLLYFIDLKAKYTYLRTMSAAYK